MQESNKNTLNNSNLSDWSHPTDTLKLYFSQRSAKISLLRLTNLSTVAGLGIHCPCFPGQRTMWNVPPREPSWQLKVVKFEWEFSMAKSCFFKSIFFFVLCLLAWLGQKRDVFVKFTSQTQLIVSSLHLLHVILLCVSNRLFKITFVENKYRQGGNLHGVRLELKMKYEYGSLLIRMNLFRDGNYFNKLRRQMSRNFPIGMSKENHKTTGLENEVKLLKRDT